MLHVVVFPPKPEEVNCVIAKGEVLWLTQGAGDYAFTSLDSFPFFTH